MTMSVNSRPTRPLPPIPKVSTEAMVSMYSCDDCSLPPPPAESKEAERSRMRAMICKEILSTEESYIEQLTIMLDIFYPALSGAGLDLGILQDLFQNVTIILGLHRTFFSDLTDRIGHWDDSVCFGDILLNCVPFMRMYTAYTGQYELGSQFLMEKIGKSKSWRKVLEQCRSDPRCGMKPLESFMIVPVQRIPRYRLLLENLIKYTDSDHPDFSVLSRALDLIAQVATKINEAMRSQQTTAYIVEIQRRLNGCVLIEPGRHFLHEGQLTCDTIPNAYVYLFNDLLVVAQSSLHNLLSLSASLSVHTLLPIDDQFSVEEMDDRELGFRITRFTKLFTFQCQTQEHLTDWIKLLKDAAAARAHIVAPAEQQPDPEPLDPAEPESEDTSTTTTTSTTANTETEDSKEKRPVKKKATHCTACETAFGGVFRRCRRYECGLCQVPICGRCSEIHSAVRKSVCDDSTDSEAVAVTMRVCQPCISALTPNGETVTASDDAGIVFTATSSRASQCDRSGWTRTIDEANGSTRWVKTAPPAATLRRSLTEPIEGRPRATSSQLQQVILATAALRGTIPSATCMPDACTHAGCSCSSFQPNAFNPKICCVCMHSRSNHS
ncbi:DH domain-containing protein [Plasmodiophora brassicae]